MHLFLETPFLRYLQFTFCTGQRDGRSAGSRNNVSNTRITLEIIERLCSHRLWDLSFRDYRLMVIQISAIIFQMLDILPSESDCLDIPCLLSLEPSNGKRKTGTTTIEGT
ncbi:hypothetical protein SADUNF_Sadunf18G0004400 [Salix dunnii]|uniref:Uncharacterized protein n=1 Tax=Salix dunnii TaxID=1413687 RepID=A0A835IZT4_9ROSI|nr:hypothetical protein SADUNF_Sadunf18G0004400 [Salix dunnii]